MTFSEMLLGKHTEYKAEYSPELLFAIPRHLKRNELLALLEVPITLDFKGEDIWNAFEISWLNLKGKPVVVLGEFRVPCHSPYLIESKSFKLYLNSFNNSRFADLNQVKECMQKDLNAACGAEIIIKLTPLHHSTIAITHLEGVSLDELDIECENYLPCPDYLTVDSTIVEEVLTSNLLKSNCLVTGQPDWASIQIAYRGNKINHEGLLKYLISLRNHNEFHEQCVERIFLDIKTRCHPVSLTVYARYTRRGGLDINPYRTTETSYAISNHRLVRQ